MSRIKLIALLATIFLVLGLGTTIVFMNKSIDRLQTELRISNTNFKALETENSSLKGKNLTYQLTIDQLNNSQDSIVTEMNKLRKQLKVKDKELKEMAYLASVAQKKDTIFLRGEPIVEGVAIDTTIQDDKWYRLRLGLEYPNKVTVEPSFTSEKYIVTYLRKEVVNPSGCKFIDFFRKKENILEVEVVETNPYITTQREKFIKKVTKDD